MKILSILIAILFFSCDSFHDKPINKEKTALNLRKNNEILSTFDRYCLLYSIARRDSNMLIFSKSGEKDTCFLFQMYKNDSTTDVIYFRETPRQFYTARQQLPEKLELHNSSVYSFKMELKYWNLAIQELNNLSFYDSISPDFPDCCDINMYRVSFNSKFYISSNDQNLESLRKFNLFLKQSLLNRIDSFENRKL
jgi:hypothetical protein